MGHGSFESRSQPLRHVFDHIIPYYSCADWGDGPHGNTDGLKVKALAEVVAAAAVLALEVLLRRLDFGRENSIVK